MSQAAKAHRLPRIPHSNATMMLQWSPFSSQRDCHADPFARYEDLEYTWPYIEKLISDGSIDMRNPPPQVSAHHRQLLAKLADEVTMSRSKLEQRRRQEQDDEGDYLCYIDGLENPQALRGG